MRKQIIFTRSGIFKNVNTNVHKMKRQYKYYYELIIRLCMLIGIVTSSFDVVGTVEIAGYTFRVSQLAMMAVFVHCFILMITEDHFTMPKGGLFLSVWILFQLLFLLRSPDLRYALTYWIWLLFDFVIVISVSFLTGRLYSFKWLIRVYMLSFLLIAGIGFIQLILYYFGYNLVLRAYWTNKLARINAFTFEPSYYATYMIMGLVVYGYQLYTECYFILSKNQLVSGFIFILVSMIFAGSRMGWLIMAILLLLVIASYVFRLLKKGTINSKLLLFIVVCTPIVFVLLLITYKALFAGDYFSLFFKGLGITGGSSGSKDLRLKGLYTCLRIFADSPIFGYSLGGVDPVIAQYYNVAFSSADSGLAMSCAGEVLVASGCIGLVPFFGFLLEIFNVNSRNTNVHKSLVLAMFFEMVILCFNQNILRLYVWFHLAMLISSLNNESYE